MDCVYLLEARYAGDYKVFLRFNTGECGEANLEKIIHKYQAAAPLREQHQFSQFYLDSWPTLAWTCGFDVAPEFLYFLTTGKSPRSSG